MSSPTIPAELASLIELAESYATKRPVQQIAVVGNAPLTSSLKRADYIDNADLVLRTNSFVLDKPGQARSQGQRTNIVLFSRMVPATPDLFRNYRERLYLLLEPMRIFGRREVWPKSWPNDLGYIPVSNREITIKLNQQLASPWQQEKLAPTTGTMGVWIAKTLFPEAEIGVTGLSFIDQPDQTSWQHQGGDSIRVGPEHRISYESIFLNKLLQTQQIKRIPE